MCVLHFRFKLKQKLCLRTVQVLLLGELKNVMEDMIFFLKYFENNLCASFKK